ncbi:MAG TPA: hypothetical protein VI216_03120, partial [Candidatus Acidoferrales bacterium]
MNERCGLGRGHFPIALFVDARAEIPLLRPLLDHKWSAALRGTARQSARCRVVFQTEHPSPYLPSLAHPSPNK